MKKYFLLLALFFIGKIKSQNFNANDDYLFKSNNQEYFSTSVLKGYLQIDSESNLDQSYQNKTSGNVLNATPSLFICNVGHYIGENFGGGIVFYVDAVGLHGLVAAPSDQSVNIQWRNAKAVFPNAIRDGIGAGSYNTELIIASQGAGNYAAITCAKYSGAGFGDWYLPSKYELNLLFIHKVLIGGFGIDRYWSSKSDEKGLAWAQDFNSGQQLNLTTLFSLPVRAIRAF